MTDEDIVARIAGIFGVPYHEYFRGEEKGWKPIYVLNLRGARAVEWMHRLRPLMGGRRQAQIDLALESYNPVRQVLSEATRQRIVEELSSGKKAPDIAAKHRVSREHVYRLARKAKAHPADFAVV